MQRLCGRRERAEEWKEPERAWGPMLWAGVEKVRVPIGPSGTRRKMSVIL